MLVFNNKSFEEIGLNALDMCEVFMGVEREFDFEIDEEDCETMTTVNDLIEFVARSPHSKWPSRLLTSLFKSLIKILK